MRAVLLLAIAGCWTGAPQQPRVQRRMITRVAPKAVPDLPAVPCPALARLAKVREFFGALQAEKIVDCWTSMPDDYYLCAYTTSSDFWFKQDEEIDNAIAECGVVPDLR